jgi:putative transposase
MLVGLLTVDDKEAPAMAGVDRRAVEEVVGRVLVDERADVLRESLRWLVARLMEVEVSELIGAERGERTPDRATHRNGYRAREWQTRAGTVELQIPKIRQGSYLPSFLQPRKRSEQALLSVVQQAYVCGVSTLCVDQLVESLGLRVSRSEVSRICAGLDEQVEAFRTRPLEGRYVYLFLDGKVEKVRGGGRPQVRGHRPRRARDRPAGDHRPGRRRRRDRDVLDRLPQGPGGPRPGRRAVGHLRCPPGLKNAITKVLGAPWQRCTVHFLRDCLGHARRDQHGLLGALIRPIFSADSIEQARDRLSEAVATLEGKLPKVAALLEAAEDDILAFYAFPADHRRKLRSTNPLERFSEESSRPRLPRRLAAAGACASRCSRGDPRPRTPRALAACTRAAARRLAAARRRPRIRRAQPDNRQADRDLTDHRDRVRYRMSRRLRSSRSSSPRASERAAPCTSTTTSQ